LDLDLLDLSSLTIGLTGADLITNIRDASMQPIREIVASTKFK